MPLINTFSYEQEILNAKLLLKKGIEDSLPVNIEKIIKFCTDNEIGFILSRNVKVTSCKDARSKRTRLGHTGIPLHDELKSIILKGVDLSGKVKVIAVHSHSDRNIDFDAITRHCGLLEFPQIMPSEELQNVYGMTYGTVNPMLLDFYFSDSIINVFDKSLLTHNTKYPGTMMTNAGDFTWGIEFDPILLVKIIKNKIIENISNPCNELLYYELPNIINPRSIGIITGNNPESGITLWSKINRQISSNLKNHFKGDISLPFISVVSLPSMGLSMELSKRESATWNAISDAVVKLEGQGIELLALACHTSHYYTEHIRKAFERNGKRFISMTEVVKSYINQQDFTDIALLGIDFIADFDNFRQYSAYSDLGHVNIEILQKDTYEILREMAYEIKKYNTASSYQKFTNLLTKIKSKNVIIALTEFSVIYESMKKVKFDKNIIDPLELYAVAIARESMGL